MMVTCRKWWKARLLVTALIVCLIGAVWVNAMRWTRHDATVRPPQFVVFTFDGSKSLAMWKESREFAHVMQDHGVRIRFTYFMSGVYFVPTTMSTVYAPPRGRAGESSIGFGGTAEDIEARVQQVRLAQSEGHEMASHGNGHFNGQGWTVIEWTSELDQFARFVSAPEMHNDVKPRMEGFRAPLMAGSPMLRDALRREGYRYDASGVRRFNSWPGKEQGLWRFGLALRMIPSRRKMVMCMDYSFFETESGAKEDTAHASQFEQEMLDTYRAYFKETYAGNRAPMQFLQHFELFNDGAYWRALRRFAAEVCGLPEVRCATYRELADYLDQQTPETLRAFQYGKFPRGTAQAPWE